MQHLSIKCDFSGKITPLEKATFRKDLAQNPLEVEDLKRWIRTFYEFEDSYLLMDTYYAMIRAAMVSNNLLGLETLWQGVYYHDRDSPNYLEDLDTAKFTTLKTFEHVLFAQMNYAEIDGKEPIDYADLLEFEGEEEKHSEIMALLQKLKPFVDEKGLLQPRKYNSDVTKMVGDAELFYRTISV